MRNNLAKRLEKVLYQDKQTEPSKLVPALRSDIRDILRCYSDLVDDIVLEVEENAEGYTIIMVAKATRFKQ